MSIRKCPFKPTVGLFAWPGRKKTKDLKSEDQVIEQHKYGCLMASLPKELAEEIIAWGRETIPDEHLGPGGRETEIHVTLKYGFTDDSEETLQTIRAILARNGPIKISIRGISQFKSGYGKWKNEDGDVLKLDVESKELHELHKTLSTSLPVIPAKYPYQPHITIAYLNPEYSGLYEGPVNPFTNREMELTEAVFSNAAGQKEIIPLSFAPLFGSKGWITMDGTHVFVDGDRNIVAGPTKLEGKPLPEKKPKKEPKTDKVKPTPFAKKKPKTAKVEKKPETPKVSEANPLEDSFEADETPSSDFPAESGVEESKPEPLSAEGKTKPATISRKQRHTIAPQYDKIADKNTRDRVEKAVINYTNKDYAGSDTGFMEMNSALRQDRVDSSTAKQSIEDFKEAFELAGHALEKDTMVFRTVAEMPFDITKIGTVFQDKGFVSTSCDEKERQHSITYRPDNKLLRIVVPKGTKVIAANRPEQEDLAEVTLNAGYKFKVVRVRKGRIIDLEIVP